MPGHIGGDIADGLATLLLDHPHGGHTDRHQCRLGVFCQGQFFLRPLEHEATEALFQRVVHFLEHQPCRGKGIRKLTAHTDFLASLTGTD